MAGEKEIVPNRDRDVNAIKAALKMIPGVGESLSQLLFEAGEDAKWRRLQDTAQEAVDLLKERKLKDETEDNEDFANFFKAAASPIGRATNEDKRQRLRDLLFKSMLIPQGDREWEDSMHCLELLQKIEAAGLYILATIAHANRNEQRLGIVRLDESPRWVFFPKVNAEGSEGYPIRFNSVRLDDLKYSPVLITKNLRSLQDLSLIERKSAGLEYGNGTQMFDYYRMTESGKFLVDWTVADF